jgi:hypothetical protein
VQRLFIAGKIFILLAITMPYLALNVATAQSVPYSHPLTLGTKEYKPADKHISWNVCSSLIARRHLPLTLPLLTEKQLECLIAGIPDTDRNSSSASFMLLFRLPKILPALSLTGAPPVVA